MQASRTWNFAFVLAVGITSFTWLARAATTHTGTYSRISQFQVFPNNNAVYFTDGQTHSCASKAHPTRFLFAKGNQELFEVLHGAFLAGREVQVDYKCASHAGSKEPFIEAARVR
jgi:hypothetical protein